MESILNKVETIIENFHIAPKNNGPNKIMNNDDFREFLKNSGQKTSAYLQGQLGMENFEYLFTTFLTSDIFDSFVDGTKPISETIQGNKEFYITMIEETIEKAPEEDKPKLVELKSLLNENFGAKFQEYPYYDLLLEKYHNFLVCVVNYTHNLGLMELLLPKIVNIDPSVKKISVRPLFQNIIQYVSLKSLRNILPKLWGEDHTVIGPLKYQITRFLIPDITQDEFKEMVSKMIKDKKKKTNELIPLYRSIAYKCDENEKYSLTEYLFKEKGLTRYEYNLIFN